MAGMTGQN